MKKTYQKPTAEIIDLEKEAIMDMPGFNEEEGGYESGW